MNKDKSDKSQTQESTTSKTPNESDNATKPSGLLDGINPVEIADSESKIAAYRPINTTKNKNK